MEDLIEKFVLTEKVRHSGSGYGSGAGSGYGSGAGYGGGYGSGGGYGNGNGYGYGNGNGNGYGDGDGSGDGNGNGNGNGYGDGDGSGDGNGYGYGDGSGSGNGYEYGDVKALNGQPIYIIDGLPITLTAIHNNIAKGYIIKEDLTLKLCYIAKVGRYFAHGYSVKQALSDAQNKYLQCKPIEERLADFNAAFPDRDKKIPAKELYKWHNILTGSCEFGRQEFCKDHKIDIDKDLLTVNEFIALTVNEYGGNIIKQL